MIPSTANNTAAPGLDVVPLYDYGRSVHDDAGAYRIGFCHALHQQSPLSADLRCSSYDHGYRRASALRTDAALHVDLAIGDPCRDAYLDGYNGNAPDDETTLTGAEYERAYMVGRVGMHLENTEGMATGTSQRGCNSRDALRYAWLRGGGFFSHATTVIGASGATGDEFDQAIDSAMAEDDE